MVVNMLLVVEQYSISHKNWVRAQSTGEGGLGYFMERAEVKEPLTQLIENNRETALSNWSIGGDVLL